MTQPLVAAVVQLSSGADCALNLAVAEAHIRAAAASGARLVALPELFTCWGPPAVMAAAAEPLDGPTGEALGRLAAELEIVLVAGSLAERVAGETRYANTSVVWGPRGERLAVYRKLHLFDVDLPGQAVYNESAQVRAGDEAVVVDTPWCRLGLAICYDLRFPELFRRLSRAGALVLVVPSAFTRATGEAHWELLTRARAVENLCYVLAPNQWGSISPTLEAHGHSLVIDPWGQVLARLESGVGWVAAPLDFSRQAELRQRLPALAHRRLD